MILKLIKIGDNLGVIIPQEELDRLELRTGDEVEITVEAVKKAE